MKKIILILLGITLNYNTFGQSTFNSETLINAIGNYVKQQNPSITKVEIKQTLNTQKFSQKGVIANISHSGKLIDNCKVNINFSYNDQTLSNVIVRIKVISDNQAISNTLFNQIHIKKGDKVKLLYYSGAICIKMDGIAMEEGNTGNIIKIKKNNSQRQLYGFIAEDGNIIIEDKKLLVNINKEK
jgi:hypothetical protein